MKPKKTKPKAASEPKPPLPTNVIRMVVQLEDTEFNRTWMVQARNLILNREKPDGRASIIKLESIAIASMHRLHEGEVKTT